MNRGNSVNNSIDNVEIVRGLYEAFAAGDSEYILNVIHPDVVWIESDGIPYGGTFKGRDAVFAGVFGAIGTEWDNFTASVDEYIDAGDRVITLGVDSGTYKATGKSMTASAASIWTLEEGKIIKFVQYIDTHVLIAATQE